MRRKNAGERRKREMGEEGEKEGIKKMGIILQGLPQRWTSIIAQKLYEKLEERIGVYTGVRKTGESFEDLAKDVLLTSKPDGIKQYDDATIEIQQIPEIYEAYIKLQDIVFNKRKLMILVLTGPD